jgi:serine/threonine protein kinase, bacterial
MPLTSGQTFAGYTILRLLGSGGMGEVYLAQHPRLPRRDALKLLPREWSADADYRARFNREADLASTLWHPHIVGVHDRGEEDGQLWISMDFVDGLDASRLLADRYPAGMPTDEVARIVTGVASALDYAHKQGLLHRDVKPANIMLTHLDDDGDQRILLTDFGIARNVNDISGLTTTNMTVGTVAYCAPEQLLGEDVDGRADQYSLAATAYHLLTGSHLFPHSNPAVVISRHLNTTPPNLGDRRPDCAGLDNVFRMALAKNPAARFPSCSAFAQALGDESPGRRAAPPNATTQAASRPGTSASTSPAGHPAKPPAAGRRHIWVALGGVAAMILLIGAIALAFRPRDNQHSNPAGTTSAAQLTSANAPASAPAPQAASPSPPVSVTVQAAPITPPTKDLQPSDPRWPTDPRFNYGAAGPHDSRFAYGVVAGEPCGNEPQEFGYTTEATHGAIATCLSPNGNGHGTWILVSSWGDFDGVHSHGSLCDSGGTAMSLDGRQMLCVTGANAIGTWEYGS